MCAMAEWLDAPRAHYTTLRIGKKIILENAASRCREYCGKTLKTDINSPNPRARPVYSLANLQERP